MKHTSGLIVGTFSPPHAGDVHVFDFACQFVHTLSVVIIDARDENDGDLIPIALRLGWIRELCPGAKVHVTKSQPAPANAAHSYEDLIGYRPDFVFGSDAATTRTLAQSLSAQFIPAGADLDSYAAREIAAAPLVHWQELPRCVRPYFVKRVCIFGPESTGKTTLAQNLAQHFATVPVVEWARLMLAERNDELREDDLRIFAQGQVASEEALAREANRVLFCDSDALTTAIWSDWLYGRCDQSILDLAKERSFDLYLLTHVDVPWVAHEQRYAPDRREEFFDRCLQELQRRSRPYVEIKGNWDLRFKSAVAAVEDLLQRN